MKVSTLAQSTNVELRTSIYFSKFFLLVFYFSGVIHVPLQGILGISTKMFAI